MAQGWVAYPETAGFDILLVREIDGAQIGIEAKLVLNAKVVEQALPNGLRWNAGEVGPDYRAVLVPHGKSTGMERICAALGITVIAMWKPEEAPYHQHRGMPWRPVLPDNGLNDDRWHEWCPVQRCPLPDYVPDG